MGHRDLSFEIEAPPERVYALLIDPDRLSDWMLGLKSVATTGPLDQPGSELTMKFGPPFTVTSKVIDSKPGIRHQVRAREMLGLVTCTTTASLEPAGAGTRLGIAFDYAVAGGPLGRRFDDKVGDEMTVNATKEYARLKAIAEAPA
jgi:carbon monoxide dehydrogenase subunit G